MQCMLIAQFSHTAHRACKWKIHNTILLRLVHAPMWMTADVSAACVLAERHDACTARTQTCTLNASCNSIQYCNHRKHARRRNFVMGYGAAVKSTELTLVRRWEYIFRVVIRTISIDYCSRASILCLKPNSRHSQSSPRWWITRKRQRTKIKIRSTMKKRP